MFVSTNLVTLTDVEANDSTNCHKIPARNCSVESPGTLLWPGAFRAPEPDLDPFLTAEVNGKTVSLLFNTHAFDKSVHSLLDCVDCDVGVKDLVHADHLPPPDCAGCHEQEAKAHRAGIHGVSHLLGPSAAAECQDCHGSHGILPVNNPASPVFMNSEASRCRRIPPNSRRGRTLAWMPAFASCCLSRYALRQPTG